MCAMRDWTKGRNLITRPVCKAWFWYSADAPVTWLPILPGILFRYENRSSRQHCSSQSLPPACLQSCLKFNFAGMPAVELCDSSSCRRCMFSFVGEMSQAVPASTSQIHRRHMRTWHNSHYNSKVTRLLRVFARASHYLFKTCRCSIDFESIDIMIFHCNLVNIDTFLFCLNSVINTSSVNKR